VLPSFLVAIRSIPGHVEIGGLSLSKGPVLLLVFLVTIWAIDITAYLIGSRIKSAKLCPDVSAGKTIGGSVAGFVAALAFAIAFAMTLHNPFLVLLGPVIGLLGQVGDLVESFLKRNFKKKDSGDLLPGHGGILDRLDSMIYAAPIAYIILSLVG
jgi:phosphatidate cytidylyltransferase